MNGNGGTKGIPQSTTNVHDWVWLGRATLEKAATQTSGRSPAVNLTTTGNNNGDMRITENPFNSNDLDHCLDNAQYVDNPQGLLVDTSTYSKNSGRRPYNEVRDSYNNFCQV